MHSSIVINFSTSSRTIIRPSRPSITLLKPGGTTPHAQSREVIIFQYHDSCPPAHRHYRRTRFLLCLCRLKLTTFQAQGGSDRYELRQIAIRRLELRSARRVEESLHRLKNLFGANEPYAIFSAEWATPPAMGAAWTAR